MSRTVFPLIKTVQSQSVMHEFRQSVKAISVSLVALIFDTPGQLPVF